MVSSTPRPHFTPGKDPVLIFQEAGWAPRPVWTGGKSRPHRDSIPERPARSQSLYRLSYRAHSMFIYYIIILEGRALKTLLVNTARHCTQYSNVVGVWENMLLFFFFFLIDATTRCEFWSAQQFSSISLYPVHFSSSS